MPILRKKDSRGSYYQWGNHGAKYRYIVGNPKSRNLAKSKAHLQERAAYSHGYKGTGILTELPGRIGRFIAGRVPQAPALDNLLLKHGTEEISHIMVGRQPIQGALKTFLNILTLGGLEKAQRSLSYDQLFHLYMNISTKSGNTFSVEKNEVIKVSPPISRANSEYVNVFHSPTPSSPAPTLNEFFGRTIAKYGLNDVVTYRAFSTNCQDFIIKCLSANNMLTDQAKKFILQDTKTILSHVPSYSEKAANFLTDLGARFKLLLGQGVRKRKKLIFRN